MDSDSMLVAGIILVLMTLPALLSAYTEGRLPRIAALLLMTGSLLIVIALKQKPSGYDFAQIPGVFERVFARLIT